MTDLIDLSQWTTERLGAAYVELLHRQSLTPLEEAERNLLQAEWSRRPTRERLGALRKQREARAQPQATGPDGKGPPLVELAAEAHP